MSRIWTLTELERLKELYPNTDVKIIAECINRPIGGIYRKAKELGIERSDEWKNKMQLLFSETLKRVGVNTRIKKGSIPPNKGKKWEEYLTEEKIKNCEKNQFKKGNIPHNMVPIGTERVLYDGYVQIKLFNGKGNDNWVLKQRFLWEQKYGPIPDGMIVEFIDGNILNFSIDNLRLVTRKENLIRNSENYVSLIKRFLKVKDENQINMIINEFPQLLDAMKKKYLIKRKLKEYGSID